MLKVTRKKMNRFLIYQSFERVEFCFHLLDSKIKI